MTDEPAISVENLSKRFELHHERRYTFKERIVRGRPKGISEFWALRDVSFEVPRGSFFGIVGHNGSGKSTALKVLAGIYRPTAGTVRTNGRLRAMIELGAGFHPELTGRENIQLNASILGLSQREIRDSIDDIIEFAGIGDFIDAPVKVYSSGMTVRLGFSVAVKMDPEILIVDEVIAVGDEEFQRRCMDHLFELRRKGTTIVLVTHSMASVEDMCDSAMWLDHGETQAIGSSGDVVNQYLQQVNDNEASRQPVRHVPATSLDALRRGTGAAQVIGLDVVGPDNQMIDPLLTGQPCRIRLTITAQRALAEYQVGFSVHSETGTVLAGPSRWSVNSDLPAGTSSVSFGMPELLLQPGSYLVSTNITADGELLDHLEKPFVLRVRDSGEPGAPGLVRLPGQWFEDTTPKA